MTRLSFGCLFALIVISNRAAVARENLLTPDLSRIDDSKSWSVINGEYGATKDAGKSVVRIEPKQKATTGSSVALALVQGVEFREGTLEVDLKGQGEKRIFLGLAFHVVDGTTFEAVYFRPFNFLREGFRDHAVQYVSWPDNTWERLRQDKPGQFESTVKPIPDPSGWFHARVEVTRQKVSVWVDNAKEPCLVVNRLANRDNGKVGLWVDSHDGSFRNLKIRPAG